MGKTLYLECGSGISGDMTVAALLDLGADEAVLRQVLAGLPVTGFDIEITRVKKAGIDCCDFNVVLQQDNHDHDMAYLHGHDHGTHQEEQSHHHDHEHPHEHPHEGEHAHEHHHAHVHRHLGDIMAILEAAPMSERARSIAKRIFMIVAEAESKSHNVPLEQVHFHEVGAVDSIVDIVSVAVCIDNLDITQVIVPRLCEGHGTIRCQHGILPIPVPATANIAAAHQLPLQFIDAEGEFVTPTGAAIVAALMTGEKLPETLRVMKMGIGAGKRNYERPSMLRAMLIENAGQDRDTILKLETNLDDCTGEALGFVMQQLLEAGARDVYYTPVYMKKNRPAYQLTILCDEDKADQMETVVFANTTTIGIRRCRYERTLLPREQAEVDTPYGKARVKVCTHNGEKRAYPEYESVSELCRQSGAGYWRVFNAVLQAANRL